MVGKGHCKFDIASDESEFADFYTTSAEAGEDDEAGDEEVDNVTQDAEGARKSNSITKVDDTTARIPSGKLFSHRSTMQAPQSRHQNRNSKAQLQPQLPASSSGEPSVQDDGKGKGVSSTSTTVAKSAKREAALALQLENLSVNDRAALAHLPVAEQRALMSIQKRELNKAKRAEKRFHSRVEMMANTVKRSTFRNDEAGHDGRRRWNV
jgi:pre-60S factor REI1